MSTTDGAAMDTAAGAADSPAAGGCTGSQTYDGHLGVRISSIFVILVTSLFGAVFPVIARRHASRYFPDWIFFFAKFFGSGVILATAFIHLLAPANEAFSNDCIADTTFVTVGYPWPEGIAFMTIFVLFFIELMTMRYAKFGTPDGLEGPDPLEKMLRRASVDPKGTGLPGDNHLAHAHDHIDTDDALASGKFEVHGALALESYAAQMTAIFILEFGVIFHSVFIGLTLAVTPWDSDSGESNFTILYIVLVFHQMFEGLGLGSRLATIPWPRGKRWTPYLLGGLYAVTTPVAIAIGLGVSTYLQDQTGLIVNSVFDSISAGILIYTGLVELLAHEFLFSPTMRRASISYVLAAYGCVVVGAGLMALLGKWA